MKTLEDKVVVITGAGSGLGAALAVEFNRAGARLALCDLNEAGMHETLAQLENGALDVSLHDVDVSDEAAMAAFAKAVVEKHGQVDVLVNNAGISLSPVKFDEIDPAAFKKVIDVNFWGMVHGVRNFLPYLKERPEGKIVTISSLAGLVGLWGYTPYSASKFAVRGLSESLQMELIGTKVSTLVVHPGGIKTDLMRNAPDLTEEAREEVHRIFLISSLSTAEKAAKRIVRAVQGKKRRLIIGMDAKLLYWIHRLLPRAKFHILGAIFSETPFSSKKINQPGEEN